MQAHFLPLLGIDGFAISVKVYLTEPGVYFRHVGIFRIGREDLARGQWAHVGIVALTVESGNMYVEIGLVDGLYDVSTLQGIPVLLAMELSAKRRGQVRCR